MTARRVVVALLAAAVLFPLPAPAPTATARAADAEKAAVCPVCGKPVQSDWSFCPFDATRLGKEGGDAMKEGSIATIRQEPARQIGRPIVLSCVKVLSVNQNHNEYAGPYKIYLGCDILVGDKRVDSTNVLVPDALSATAGQLAGEKKIKITGSFRGLDNDYQSSLLVEAQTIEILP